MTRAGELSLVPARLEKPPISSPLSRSNRLRRPEPEPCECKVGRGRPDGSPGGIRMSSEPPRMWVTGRCPRLRRGVGGGMAQGSGPAASPLSEGVCGCTAIATACLASALRRKDSLLRPLVAWCCFFLGGRVRGSASGSDASDTGSSSHSSFSSSATTLGTWEPFTSDGVAIFIPLPFLLDLLVLLEVLEGRLVFPVAGSTNS